MAALRFGVFDLWRVAGRTGAAGRIWRVLLSASTSSGASPGTSSGRRGVEGLQGPICPVYGVLNFSDMLDQIAHLIHGVGRRALLALPVIFKRRDFRGVVGISLSSTAESRI